MTSEDYIISVECVSESVCLATRNGDILLYNIQTSDVCTLEPLYEDTSLNRTPQVPLMHAFQPCHRWTMLVVLKVDCSEWRGAQTMSWSFSVPERDRSS